MNLKNKNILKIFQIAPKALFGKLPLLVFFAFTILLFSFNFNTAEAATIAVPSNSLG